MSSQLADALQRDKRPRPDDSSSSDHASDVQLSKRACSVQTVSESNCSTIYALELYEFENPLETNSAESATQEDLVSEMMRSLEKAIGGTEDSSLPPLPVDGITSTHLLSCPIDGASAPEFSSTAPIVSSDLYAKSRQSCELSESDYSAAISGSSLFDSIDDDPGVLDYSRVDLAFLDIVGVESPQVDNSCSDTIVNSNLLQTTTGFFPLLRNDWLDDSFDQLEESGFDHVRDSCDLVSLDYCF